METHVFFASNKKFVSCMLFKDNTTGRSNEGQWVSKIVLICVISFANSVHEVSFSWDSSAANVRGEFDAGPRPMTDLNEEKKPVCCFWDRSFSSAIAETRSDSMGFFLVSRSMKNVKWSINCGVSDITGDEWNAASCRAMSWLKTTMIFNWRALRSAAMRLTGYAGLSYPWTCHQ